MSSVPAFIVVNHPMGRVVKRRWTFWEQQDMDSWFPAPFCDDPHFPEWVARNLEDCFKFGYALELRNEEWA